MKKLPVLIVSIIIVGVSLSGCGKSYLNINSPNPNAATNASPQLVITNAMTVTASGTIAITGVNSVQYISGWLGYWGPSGSYAPSSQDVASYYQTTGYGNNFWIGAYRNLEDYYYVQNSARQAGNPYFVAMAKAMSAVVWQALVDQFNNVPYKQALQGTIVITPKYDSGQTIYEDLALQLDSAAALMTSPSAVALPNSDIMFNGNNTSWIQFANTLKLRILMRQTQMPGRAGYITAEIAKILANGGGFLTTDASVNPGYANNNLQQNPLWGYFRTLTGLPTSGGQADYWRAAQYSIDVLKSYNDPRLSKIYDTVSNGTFVGSILGAPNNVPGNGTSSLGSGLLKSVSQNAIIISAAESNFLQAEAIVRGYMTGDPKVAYEAGVKASFAYLLAGDPTAYLSSGNPNTTWTAAVGTAGQISLIIRQKWIANNGVTPFESYADYRRLHLPADIPISISSYKNPPNAQIPVRWLYPVSEYTTNNANVSAQGNIDYYNSKVFWNQ